MLSYSGWSETRLEALLDQVAELESAWSFPGREEVDRLRDLASRAARPDGAPERNELRQRLARWCAVLEPPTPSQRTATTGPDGRARPTFDVLWVGPPDDHAMGRVAEASDENFGWVVVGDVAAALVVLRSNTSIAAIVLSPFADDLAHLDALSSYRVEVPFFALRNPDALGLGAFVREEFGVSAGAERLGRKITSDWKERASSPWFSALTDYAGRPIISLHALPVSHQGSVRNSPALTEFAEHVGAKALNAETSSTLGGLDSLLEPTGSLKKAQSMAGRAFGSLEKFTRFVTNGTSTANKIVAQALFRTDDIVIIDHECHKSWHYALALSGARPLYVDAYALDEYGLYGGISRADLLAAVDSLRLSGRLDQLRAVVLTNCTFDGIVYDPERIMSELLAIKPDLYFVWDEAWFASARFHPALRRRTAMAAAAALDPASEAVPMVKKLHPDSSLKVWATQSTHKTLSALRQGSMIHVYDNRFAEAEYAFEEAYMTHTSTSPSYLILASLDAARLQVDLEGTPLVLRSHAIARAIREEFAAVDDLRVSALGPSDLIPACFRASGTTDFEEAWNDGCSTDELVLDPTRVTVSLTETALTGQTVRRRLMDEEDVHLNKTTATTLLLLTHIGTPTDIASTLVQRIHRVTTTSSGGARPAAVPLPRFSGFHSRYTGGGDVRDGDLRKAYLDSVKKEVVSATVAEAIKEDERGEPLVSAGFVTPYPPGFPILLPGQVIRQDACRFLEALDVSEVHGYASRKLRVFK